MNKKKILSLIMALVMLVGVFSPLSALAAPQAGTPVGATAKTETKANVTIHKIKVKSTEGFPLEQQEGATEIVGKNFEKKNTKYDGGKIDDTNIKDFFGDGAEELAKVTFTYWVFGGTGNDDTDKTAKENYEKMVANPGSYDTVDKVKALLGEGEDVETTKTGVAIPEITVPANGHKYVWAVEKSKTITGDDKKQQTITGAKAVPFGLALPLFKADGSVNTNIHVYPKNTTANEPQVDKDFKGKANAETERKEITNNIVEDAYVGQVKEYDIETIIPEGAKYKTVAWTDQMTEGLTFNNNVKIMIGTKGAETEWEAANYSVKIDNNGFVLELTETGLKALEEKAKTGKFRLLVQYSATVNDKAKVDRQERNDVVFHYGNDPHHGNTPYPTKPSNGSLTVNKEFTGATGDWKDGEKVTVTLIDAHTGKAVENLPNGQTAVVVLTKGTKTEHTWTGLDNDRQYIVKETFTAGDEVTYVKQADGSIKIEDRKTDNPTPKDPEEPGVVVYGHRFQKIDQEGTGLANAEFIIQRTVDGKTEYLVKKGNTKLEADQTDYIAAEKAYKDAVKENKKSAEEIAKLKVARDKAYVKAQSAWEFNASKDNATVFKSGTDGYFKVTGIPAGDYELVETKEPAGYAKLTAPVPFKVGEGSTGVTELKGEKLEDAKGFTQVENKKVTIPQTGGMGTVLFTVVGISLMAGAVIAMKKNREEA